MKINVYPSVLQHAFDTQPSIRMALLVWIRLSKAFLFAFC